MGTDMDILKKIIHNQYSNGEDSKKYLLRQKQRKKIEKRSEIAPTNGSISAIKGEYPS